MDESILRNLDTQSRRLAEIEADIDLRLAGDLLSTRPAGVEIREGLGYAELSDLNDALRAERGWDEIDLAAALTPAQCAAFERWRDRQRLEWGVDDVVAVGFAGAIGFAATWFDADLDRALRDRLGSLKDSELVRAWEREGRGLAIDHVGPGFGGPAHRVRSPGHDLARPIAALRQIRDGVFRGYRWEDKIRQPVTVRGFVEVDSMADALGLWVKHLAADFVTKMSLPLPGWTLLCEMPHRRLRKFAHDVYRGTAPGEGLNLRSGAVTPTLAVISSEVIVRTHVHARAIARSGSASLSISEKNLRSELLLAAHAVVGAASLGKTLARSMALGTGPMALRHINVPVLLRIGMLALEVRSSAKARSGAAAPGWEEMLADMSELEAIDSAAHLFGSDGVV